LHKYVEQGSEELFEDRLGSILNLKYNSLFDAQKELGDVEQIRSTFFDFQKILYSEFEAEARG
jgi:type I restriction enzyme, R subunit